MRIISVITEKILKNWTKSDILNPHLSLFSQVSYLSSFTFHLVHRSSFIAPGQLLEKGIYVPEENLTEEEKELRRKICNERLLSKDKTQGELF